jgi:hypothetical protein
MRRLPLCAKLASRCRSFVQQASDIFAKRRMAQEMAFSLPSGKFEFAGDVPVDARKTIIEFA